MPTPFATVALLSGWLIASAKFIPPRVLPDNRQDESVTRWSSVTCALSGSFFHSVMTSETFSWRPCTTPSSRAAARRIPFSVFVALATSRAVDAFPVW